jgi:hypothetical protein
VHVVDAPAGFRVRDGGHAIADARPPEAGTRTYSALVRRRDGLTGLVRALFGFTTAGVARARDASAFGEHAATPFVAADHAGGTAVYVSLVALSGGPPDEAWAAHVLDVTETRVTLRLPGGDTVSVGPGARVDTVAEGRGGSV